MNNYALVFLVVEVFLFAGFLFFSIMNYKERFKSNYDLRNHFPYELNFESPYKENFLGNTLLLLATASGIAFYVLFDNNKTNGYFMFIMIGGIVHLLAMFFLVFVPLKLLKSHLVLVTLDIILSFLIPFALAISASFRFYHTNDAIYMIFIIIPAVICLWVFIMMMNPKLTNWSRMDKKKNEDGSITYTRPRYFILALYEWMLMFTSLATQIVIIFSTLLIK